MAQLFHPSTNTFSRASIFGAVFFLAGLAWLGGAVYRSPWSTQADVVRPQPVPFTHQLHAGDLGIDCRYCHAFVEDGPVAGLPPTQTCMNCHSQIWADQPMLEPVRESFRTGRPLEWIRVHDIADFAYFDHGIHVKKGVGCATCHGPVDRMPLMWKTQTLFMEWCLECHREPERFVRPPDRVFDMAWRPPPDQLALGRRLVHELGIEKPTSCSVCHR